MSVFKQSVITFIQQKTRLFQLIGDRVDSESCFYLIKGCVQSGKSRIIHALCLYYYLVLEQNVIVIVRNFSDDYDQFKRGFEKFVLEFTEFINQTFFEIPSILYVGNIKRKSLENCENILADRNILVALANCDQISKINDYLLQKPTTFKAIIDEIDQIGFSTGKRFDPQLKHFIDQYTDTVFGISATLFEPIQTEKFGFKTHSVFYLDPPSNYKGITDIHFHFIQKTNGNLLDDSDLDSYLNIHHDQKPFQNHPMITLIKTENTIVQQDILLNMIAKKYPSEYTIITYNGTSCKLYSSQLLDTTIVLPVCKKMSKFKHGLQVFKNTPLPYVLQYLKNNGGANLFPRILIIAYKLVGRGINIVSEDFGWHLTHMFYRPSPTTDVTNLIQSMRLCGIYTDSIKLNCYISKIDYENLYKGYMLQEDLLSRIMKNKSLENEIVFIEKIPKRGLYRNVKYRGKTTTIEKNDTGMKMENFNEKQCVFVEKELSVDGVDIKKLEKWKIENSQTLVWKMICFLSEQKTAIDLSTFKDGVEYDGSEQMFRSNVDNGKSIKARNGKLWNCRNNYNQIEINKNIVEYIK